MNILFIDSKCSDINSNSITKRFMYKYLGYYINKYNKNYMSVLVIDENKFNNVLLSKIIRYLYNKQKVYIVLSREISKNKLIKRIINENINDKIFVTEQNNLYYNDMKYISEYISKNNLKREKIKILFVIDEITEHIKNKIMQFVNEYKTIDIMITSKSKYNEIKKYVYYINNTEGTSIDIIYNKLTQCYNIVLVFSTNYEYKHLHSNSFILDYNNSDLDIKSNTYLVYLKNEKYFLDMFSNINLDISRFEKTKLGKLYIHTSRLILDK